MAVDTRVDISEGDAEVEVELEKVPEVRGIVLDPDGGPAPGSLVRLAPDIPEIPGLDFLDTSLIFLAVGVTDLEGKFKFSGFRGARDSGKFRVIADHVLHARGRSEPFSLDGAAGAVEVEVRLARGAKVKGVVTDGRGPVGGAAVRLRKVQSQEGMGGNDPRRFMAMLGLPKGGQTTSTGRDGTFDFGKVLPGDYAVSAEAAGYIDCPEQTVQLAAGDERNVELVLDPGKTITGSVVQAAGGALEGARVRLLAEKGGVEGSDEGFLQAQRLFGGAYKSTKSGGEGSFLFAGLPRGRYTVIAEHPGFTPYERSGVEAGEKDVRAVLVPSATLKGTVVDAATGQPVKQFRVTLQKAGSGEEIAGRADAAAFLGRETTDPSGRFVRDDLAEGKYKVVIAAQGYTVAKDDVVLMAGTAAERTFVLAQAGRVRGIVVTKDRGEPIAGARISYLQGSRTEGSGADGKKDGNKKEAAADPKAEDARAMGETFGRQWLEEAAFSGDDGAFLLEGVPEGPQTIVVTHQDFITGFADGVEVGLGEEVEVTFRIDRGLSVSGTVTVESGGRAQSRVVFVRGAGDDNARVRKMAFTDAEGAFRVSGLDKGRYRVIVAQQGGKPAPEPIEVELINADSEGLEIRMPE